MATSRYGANAGQIANNYAQWEAQNIDKYNQIQELQSSTDNDIIRNIPLIGKPAQAAVDSFLSTIGGIADYAGNPAGIGDTINDYVTAHEMAMGEKPEASFSWDYFMNGLPRDTGGLIGSMASLGIPTLAGVAAAPVVGASMPVAAGIGGIIGAGGEALAEGGSKLRESLASGETLDTAQDKARSVAGKNFAILAPLNLLELGTFAKVGQGIKNAYRAAKGTENAAKPSAFGNLLKGTGTTGAGALNEGYQEYVQEGIQSSVEPNEYYSYIPGYGNEQQNEAFASTIGPMLALGGLGGGARMAAGKLGQYAKPDELNLNEAIEGDAAQPQPVSIPAQANYTIADEVSDANLSQGTESKLRMLDEAYYKQYGQHLYVTSMTRHWGTNSDHETGSAFDVADDGLANDAERRQWIAEKARQLGLNPLDEYENPSSGATGGHMHFSDKGGAVNVDTSGWSGNADIDNLINEAANKYGIDPNLVAAIAEQESGFNQSAQSEAGALGIMQLMPDTANGLGVDANDLAGNIEGGAKYIKQMLDQFGGDLHKALEAYNGGPGGVGNAQTMKYADEVMQRYEKFKAKSAGTFSWSKPAGTNTTTTDYMKIMSDNNVTADTAGDFLQYVQLLAEDDANANSEQVQKDGAKAVKAIADGSPDVMERVAKELGYGQVKQEVEQKAPNIPMPKIRQHVQQNGWVEIGNKKDADEFARTDYGKTLERVSNTKFVSPDFNAITGKVEQRTAQPQQVAQPAPQPTVQNKVQSDVAQPQSKTEEKQKRNDRPLSAGEVNILNSIAQKMPQEELRTIAQHMRNGEYNTVRGIIQQYNPEASLIADNVGKAIAIARNLLGNPMATQNKSGTRIDVKKAERILKGRNLDVINRLNLSMGRNLKSNGEPMSAGLKFPPPDRSVENVERARVAAAKVAERGIPYSGEVGSNRGAQAPAVEEIKFPEPKLEEDNIPTGLKAKLNKVANNLSAENATTAENTLAKTKQSGKPAVNPTEELFDTNNVKKNINTPNESVSKPQKKPTEGKSSQQEPMPPQSASDGENTVSLKNIEGFTDRDLREAEKMGISFTSKGRLVDGKPVYDIEFASQKDADKFVREFFGKPENGDAEAEIKTVSKDIEKENAIDENIKNGKNAIKTILKNHKDVPKAMYRDEVGYIDFVYGKEGTTKKDRSDGYGLAKILEKHGKEAVDKIPEVVAKGKYEKSEYGDRAYFLFDGYRAVVRFTWDGDKKVWLVTNFLDDKNMNKKKKESDDADAFVRSAPTADGTTSPSEQNPSEDSIPQSKENLNKEKQEIQINSLSERIALDEEGQDAYQIIYNELSLNPYVKLGRNDNVEALSKLIAFHAQSMASVMRYYGDKGYTASQYVRDLITRMSYDEGNTAKHSAVRGTTSAMYNKDVDKLVDMKIMLSAKNNNETGTGRLKTFIHELGHYFFFELYNIAHDKNSKCPKQLRDDFNLIYEWMGADTNLNIEQNLESNSEFNMEKVAQGLSKYVSEGKLPAPELQSAFQRIINALKKYIDKAIKILEQKKKSDSFLDRSWAKKYEFPVIPDNIRAAMDRMFIYNAPVSEVINTLSEARNSKIVTDDGKEYDVVYKVMPAEKVVASNLPTDGLPVNKDYPSAMQPRNRQRAAMQEQITSMSNNLRPADLTESRNLNQGAPVIKPDGAVLNGNGRTIAIQRAWLNGKADKYKQYLLDNAEKLGLNPADIENVEHPILVRVVQDELSKDDIMSMINSTTGGQRMSPSEQAKVDSGKIKSSTLNQYVAGSDLTSAANRNFLRDVLADIISPSERNAYYNREGAINQDGVLRAQRALFALAYGDDTLLDAFSEAVNEEAKNFSNALKANAPLVARLQQLIKTGNATELGLQKNLVSAVKALKEAVIAGKPAKSIWQEMSMFEDAEYSPETLAMARAMDGYRRSGKKLTQFVRNLAELGLKHGNPNQTGLFGEEAAPQVKLTDDIATAKEYVDTGNQIDMFAPKNSRSAFSFANPDTAEELKSVGDIDTPLDRLPKLPASKLRDGERKIQAFGKAIGVPVHFVNHPDKGYRGIFTHNGEVYINRNAAVPVKSIFLHEFTHWLKASGKENRAVFDALAACVERDSGLFHERRLKQYRDRIFGGERMTDEEIIEEIICDAMGNSKAAEQIAKAIDGFAPELNQSIWGRIKAMWDKFCQMVGFRQELSSKKQSLPNGLSQQEMAKFNAQLNILMSKMRTADGKPMFKVENYQLVVADNNQRPAEMFDINNINDYTPTYNIPALPDSYSYQVHAQREAVRQQYEGTDEWMKAPNGEPTNLTEEQWLDVRTPNFKAWFGDWENNPDEASKVVDENGEPLVVYHGTATDNLVEFSHRRAQDKTGRAMALGLGKGKFYFTDSEAGANLAAQGAQYRGQGNSPQAMPVFINIRNPISESEYGSRFKEATGKELSQGYDNAYSMTDRDKGIAKLDKALKKEGYDGIIANIDNKNLGQIATFNPNQIKSAAENTGAFSPDTNNIKYSRGRAGITASTNNVGIFKRAMTALENKLKGKMPDNLQVRTYEDIEADRENARRAKAISRGKEYIDRSKEVSPLGQWWASPSRIAKKIPLISPFVQMGKIAVDKQEKLRAEFNSGMNEIEDMLGYSKWGLNDKRYKERKMALQEALLQGDINRKVFTDNELKSGGLDEQTIKAYHKMRELLDKAYTMADQTYSRIKYVSRNWPTAAEADGFMNDLMKKNPFVQIIQKKQNADGTVTYTYKEPHQYTVSALTVTAAELGELKKNKDVIIKSEKLISGTTPNDSVYQVTYHQKKANLGKIQGYIPHIFHGWLVCEVDENGNIIKDSAGNIVVVTSKNSMTEAVKEGKKIAGQNADKHYMVVPKLSKFNDGAAERAAIMGDFDYSKTMSKVANGMKMSIADAEKFMNGTVAVQNRGRFLAYAQHRKGVQGYEQNVFLATQMYFNQIARYVALDPFKRDAISMYNRLFGSFTDNTVTRRSENAKYVYAYINDMNGMPSGFEKWANKMLHNMGLGQEVANGRPALWLERMIFTYPFTIAKLGVFNVSSALLNLTQLFNLYGAMGEKVLSSAGYERLLKKGFMDARKAIVDKNSPLGQLVWKDLGLEAQIGIDVAGGYSRTEVNGLASLTGRLSKLAGGSMYLFRLSDTYTRAVTLLTAYNKALDEGMTKQDAIEYAKEINDKVNFDYSVADSPGIFRAFGPLSNVLLQFQKYPVKQIELFMDIFNDGRAAGLNRKQSALRLMKYVAPYMAFSGMMGIPFISLAGGILSAIMSAATGDDWDWQQKIKQYMLETFGADNPLTLWWLYGAGSFIGINVGIRVGVGEFMGIENREKRPIDSILGMTIATSTVAQTAKQLGYGNYAEAVKAISPSAGNILIGLKGEVHTTRGRMKYQYQNAYEQALRMIGLNPLNETMAGDIASNDYANKQSDKRAKDDAIDDFLDEPTAENAARLNEFGVTPKSIKTEMARRKMNRAELNRLAEEEKAAKAKKSKQKKKQYSVNDYLKGK